MPTFPEAFLLRPAKPKRGLASLLAVRRLARSSLLLPSMLLLSGCALVSPAAPLAEGGASGGAMPTTRSAALSAPAAPSAPVATPAPAMAALPHQPDAALALVSYAERLRTLLPNELSAELLRLAPSATPSSQLQLALALAQVQQLPELIRAQETVAKVLGDTSDEAKALHPLARLLAMRLSEQRRLEELLDKQTQQVKELQRRLDQSTERLEALKAIERSLVSRPVPASPSPSPSPAVPPASSQRARTTPTAPATSPAVRGVKALQPAVPQP